ncbi:hypothetical protein QBC35DRAFT_539756 [Podospora australis]|uniref:NACHT domain-containing protein n=1 Tax=Podospora australis TaxID=1536484 RepID=A0AAN7ADL7_9PEZI|nr:hypothetical protein QBC35DRAFT_539756 [Podospora australis]
MSEGSSPEPPPKRIRLDTTEASTKRQKAPNNSSSTTRAVYERPSSRQDFQIAIICALSLEYDAVSLLFDEIWDNRGYGRANGDTNHDTTVAAAAAAASLRSSYPNLKLGLLVGICGGAPSPFSGELLLGDVVISKTVLEYDFGRQYHDKFVTKETIPESLGRPGKDIRGLIVLIESEPGIERLRQSTATHLACLQTTAVQKQRRQNYEYPSFDADKLFHSAYRHKHRGPRPCALCDGETGQQHCADAAQVCCAQLGCDNRQLISRKRLESKSTVEPEEAASPKVFFGRIASGDTVMKSSEHQDRIAKDHDVSKTWQPYAAATAAAVAKGVLEQFPLDDKQLLAKETARLKLAAAADAKYKRLLGSLQYKSMNQRRTQIEDPHDGTFSWLLGPQSYSDSAEAEFMPNSQFSDDEVTSDIDMAQVDHTSPARDSTSTMGWYEHWFQYGGCLSRREDSSAQFLKWLQSCSDTLFWISGKAGSGKSTLMKFLVTDKRTLQNLDRSGDFIILSHFIWIAGQAMERKIKGVLCSLLHQLLASDGSLAESLTTKCPQVTAKDYVSDWEEKDLWGALEYALRHSIKSTCIFLDGLDEISSDRPDGQSFVFELIQALRRIPRVKLCVSSRPEPLWQNKLVYFPMFRVQDLTELDIWRYTSDRVRKWFQPHLGNVSDRLISSVCERAQGVFLWVALALRSLERGLQNGDNSDELMSRLTTLPPGLRDLYKEMWKRHGDDADIYIEEAAKYLNIVLGSTVLG